MADRYKKLLAIEGPLWRDGSPFAIQKGALLLDGVKNQALLQLRLKNIQSKPLKAVVVAVELADITGNSLGEARCTYLDLNAVNGESFGESIPVYLDDLTARGFRFRVSSAVFSDGSTWDSDTFFSQVPAANSLDGFGDLKQQFTRDISELKSGVTAQVMPTDLEGVWYCACGALNAVHNEACSTCGLGHAQQHAATNRDLLSKHSEAAAEAQRAETERKADAEHTADRERARRTRTVTVLGIVAAIALVVVAFCLVEFVLPSFRYSQAVAAAERGDLQTARKTFSALGQYRDSASRAQSAAIEQIQGEWHGTPEANGESVDFDIDMTIGGTSASIAWTPNDGRRASRATADVKVLSVDPPSFSIEVPGGGHNTDGKYWADDLGTDQAELSLEDPSDWHEFRLHR